jgi:hypothetical protein
MRNLLTIFAAVFMSWMHNAQAQPLTVDPETIVPLPDKFDIETPALMCRPRLLAFRARGSEPGTTIDIFSWSSASRPMGMRMWFSHNQTRRFTA